ncbi:hypothetical protein [Methylobacterium sp. WSM2598]|uniref:hypothetical protein n=1 Tax=Methylobacterium sp. WSM2598 TaxID=398261 RepID=UPI00036C6E87|nr:hypothetical protein [Methylobacterium sp. WSM2598]
MKAIKTMMMASLALATLAAGMSGADARGGSGGRGFGRGRGIAVGEPHPGGFGGHHGGWGHGGFHRHGGFYPIGWGGAAGGYLMSSYGGYGDCEMIFNPLKNRYVRACD